MARSIEKKKSFSNLFVQRSVINQWKITYTQHQHTQFSMDLELVLVDLWLNRTMHTQTHTQYRKRWTIFPTTMANTIDTLETMCYFKLIYCSFMDIGPLMVAIDSIYFYTKGKQNWKSFFPSFSIVLLSAAYSRQQYNPIELTMNICFNLVGIAMLYVNCESIQFQHSNEQFVCFWVPHEIESILYFSSSFFHRHQCCSIVHFNWFNF